jgi:hypothetical protein
VSDLCCHRCEVDWRSADGRRCWSCGVIGQPGTILARHALEESRHTTGWPYTRIGHLRCIYTPEDAALWAW